MMKKANSQGYEILSKGELEMLRTRAEADRKHYMRCQTRAELPVRKRRLPKVVFRDMVIQPQDGAGGRKDWFHI